MSDEWDGLRRGLADLAEQAGTTDLYDRTLQASRRLGRRRAALSAAAALGISALLALPFAVLHRPGPPDTSPPAPPAATVPVSPAPSDPYPSGPVPSGPASSGSAPSDPASADPQPSDAIPTSSFPPPRNQQPPVPSASVPTPKKS